jgi:DNA invertase Pin-like site-specific DNA recombinase
MNNAVIYCRVSSKEQLDGTSLESQEEACRVYAKQKGMEVLKVFVEEGESAKFADRTQLLTLIDFCRQSNGQVQTLLVWKVDRFTRNSSDYYAVKSTLMRYGVLRIVSVTEPIDASPTGKLMEGVLASFAQFDNDVRAARTLQGMQRRLQEGIFPWRPPFGYKSSVASGEKKSVPDVPDQPAFGLLQRAWKLFAMGAYTQAEMGRLMESWGLASAHGGSFSPQSLSRIFSNPYYAGILVDPWGGKEYEGKHTAMVTREEYARVQQIIAGRNRSVVHQKVRPEFPLRGLALCDACGHAVTGAFTRGRSRRYAYYVCQHASCAQRGKSHPAGAVHDEFEQFLDSVAPEPEILERVADILAEEAKHYETELAVRTANRKTRAAQLERELQGIIGMRAQGLITDEEFLRHRKIILSQRNAVESQGACRRLDVTEAREQFKEIATPLIQLRETWQTIQPPFRRRFERLVLPAGFIIGKTRTAELGGLFSVLQGFAHPVSIGVARPSSHSNLIIPDIVSFWQVLKAAEGKDEELVAQVRA